MSFSCHWMNSTSCAFYSASFTRVLSVLITAPFPKRALCELLGARIECIPDSWVGRPGDDDPLIILQTQHGARVTSQYFQTLQRLLIPDLWWKGEQGGKKGKIRWLQKARLQRGTRADPPTWQNKQKMVRGEKVADLGHAKNGPFSLRFSCPISPPHSRAPGCAFSSSHLPRSQQYGYKYAPLSLSSVSRGAFLPGQTIKKKV